MAALQLVHRNSTRSDPVIARRTLLVLSAAAAAAFLVPRGASHAVVDRLSSIGNARWGWRVELAVLERLAEDRSGALNLLLAALAQDLGSRRPPAYRLYDLYAAASGPTDRAALASLVEARSSDPRLRARATLWADPTRARRSPLWRTTGANGQPIGILVGAA